MYTSKVADRDSYKGKQIMGHFPPVGNNVMDMYNKEHSYIGKVQSATLP